MQIMFQLRHWHYNIKSRWHCNFKIYGNPILHLGHDLRIKPCLSELILVIHLAIFCKLFFFFYLFRIYDFMQVLYHCSIKIFLECTFFETGPSGKLFFSIFDWNEINYVHIFIVYGSAAYKYLQGNTSSNTRAKSC